MTEYLDMQETPVDKIDVFAWLKTVQESGQINMFGAASYIREEFDVDKRTAEALLQAWMDSFE